MVRIVTAGDRAVTVEFDNVIDDRTSAKVIALDAALKAAPVDGVIETVPTYRSLMVLYDPAKVRGRALTEVLLDRASYLSEEPTTGRLFHVPACYEGDGALDLEALAALKKTTTDALLALHAGATYRVYMIGFAPGFTYLGGLPEALHTPRLDEPRQRVEAGSIGIGGSQSCISSSPGPSGWRYIARTPLRLFDANRSEPAFFRAGDLIRFTPVSLNEFTALEQRIAAGEATLEPETP